MRGYVLPAVAVTMFTAAIAAPVAASKPLHHFVQDGDSYSYIVTRTAKGALQLRGSNDTTGELMALRVDGDHVAGTVGMSSVAFHVSPELASQLAYEADEDAGAVG